MRTHAQMIAILDREGPAFIEAFNNDTTLNSMLRAGYSMEQIVVQLSRDKAALFKSFVKQINVLEAIAPRKIVGDDGKVYVYRCPDHLIPNPPEYTPDPSLIQPIEDKDTASSLPPFQQASDPNDRDVKLNYKCNLPTPPL